MNPFVIWKEQSPRQIFELLLSYRDMHKESGDGGSVKGEKGKAIKLPKWYKKPASGKVFHMDDVNNSDIY